MALELASAESVARLLGEYGAVVVEGAASEAAMDELARDIERDRSGTFRGNDGSFAGKDITRNSAKPLGESGVARELATNELVVGVAEQYLGPWCKRIRLGACTAMYVEPPDDMAEPPAPPQVIHRDDMLWVAADWMHSESLCHKESLPAFGISVIWAVSDFTALNGATRVAVKSHKQCPRTKDPPPDTTFAQAVMPKGSVLLWDAGTFHGAGARANYTSDLTRHASTRKSLFFQYQLGWLQTEHNFHNAMPADVIRSMPDKLKSLLGYDGINAKDHPWYSGPVYTLPYMGGSQGHAAGEGVQF